MWPVLMAEEGRYEEIKHVYGRTGEMAVQASCPELKSPKTRKTAGRDSAYPAAAVLGKQRRGDPWSSLASQTIWIDELWVQGEILP